MQSIENRIRTKLECVWTKNGGPHSPGSHKKKTCVDCGPNPWRVEIGRGSEFETHTHAHWQPTTGGCRFVKPLVNPNIDCLVNI